MASSPKLDALVNVRERLYYALLVAASVIVYAGVGPRQSRTWRR
jgi:hypothetical protein